MAEGFSLLRALAKGARYLGIAVVALGVLAMLAPVASGGTALVLVGLVVVAAGLVRAAFGWHAWSLDKGPFGVVVGGLTALFGLVLVANPVSSLGLVTTLAAIYLVVDGLAELPGALRLTRDEGLDWMWAEALWSIALGISMWVGWPFSGARALGILVGAKLVSAGAVMIRVERRLRRVGEGVQKVGARLSGFLERDD
jgi:uncharacterized membrane protein HdeD (DUF308 family)